MQPRFSCTMWGMASRQQLNTPPRFTSTMRRHSASLMSVSSPDQAMPALHTSSSKGPAESNMAHTCALSATSALTASVPSSAARASAFSLLPR